MRKDTIRIGGKPYNVVGLSVSQSMAIDLDHLEVEKTGTTEQKVRHRIRRMAQALQNAEEFVPDPKKPGGEFKTSERTVEEVIDAVTAAFDGNMAEFYAAEQTVHKMNWPDPPAGVKPAEGEKPATG